MGHFWANKIFRQFSVILAYLRDVLARLDEGGMLEDPYVRLVLEPWGDAAAAQV